MNQKQLHQLISYGKLLNRELEKDPGPHALKRESEVNHLCRLLQEKPSRSFILVGPSGCGKTSIVHELVKRLGTGDNPFHFLATSTSMMLTGTKYLGEWETRVHNLIEIARKASQLVIFFSDIVHLKTIGTAVKSDENVGSFLEPFLERREITVIGECTEEEFHQGFDRHPSFRNLFQIIRLNEIGVEDAGEVLKETARHRSRRHLQETGIELIFPDSVSERILDLSHNFFPGRSYPGKAIQLLEQVFGMFKEKPDDEQDAASTKGPIRVQQHHVIKALAQTTGIPSLLLDDSIPLELSQAKNFLEARVLGQPVALKAVLDTITLVKAGVTDPEKPMGIFFFVGPTGVGKTELAKALAEFIFGSPDRMIRFDMSEYKDYSSFEKLIGNPQAPVDSPHHAGALTSRVRQQPFSVVLFDEIEKAHPNIFDLFLQVFDDGRLTDPRGTTTNFTHTILIMTSNVGSEFGQAPSIGFGQTSQADREAKVRTAMRGVFRPEFLNRIDRIVVFHALGLQHMRTLAKRELGKVLLRSGITRRNMRIDVDPGVIEILVRQGFSPEFGARPLKRAVEQLALLPVARQIVKMSGETMGPLLRLTPAGDSIKVRIVQDAESRKAKAVARGVTIEDPLQQKKIRIKPNQIDERITALLGRIENLAESCKSSDLQNEKSELVERTTEINFWDDSSEARRVLSRIHRLERIMEAVDRVKKRATDLASFTQLSAQNRDAVGLQTAATRLQDIERHAEIVSYSLHCRERLERSDAFIDITLIDAEPARDNVVGLLAEMYAGWAKSKGFSTTWVHEETSQDPQVSRSITLLIEGVSVFGILRSEEGVHEIVYGKSGMKEKTSKYVKVELLPQLEGSETVLSSFDIGVEEKSAKGKGICIARYRSDVTLTHKPSLISVQGKSGQESQEATEVLTDLLTSRVRRRQLVDSGATERAAADHLDQVIRKYTISPRRSVKDQRTGVSTTRLDDVWAGGIDDFIKAQISMVDATRAEESTK